MNIIDAIDDPAILGGAIKDPETWAAWRAFLKALFGLPMDDAEAEVFRTCTGRETLPTVAFAAAWLICGRRGGKSFALALIAVFLAIFRDYTPHLAIGEVATIMVIARDKKQARAIFRYIHGLLLSVPSFAQLIEGQPKGEITLSNRVSIEIMAAQPGSLRGYAIPAVLLDEVAFWSVEGSPNADVEIIGAIRPAMRQFPDPVFLAASSPWSQRGVLWEAFKKHHGDDKSGALVWRAPTWVMNPTLPRTHPEIEEDFQADPIRAATEYGAEFRSDLEAFVSREVVEAAVEPGRVELPRMGSREYVAFVDPSGGSVDAMTLGIAHREGDIIVLDALRARKPPFSPEAVVAEFASLIKSYGISRVTGDRYAGEFAREPFRKLGIAYDLSDRPRSDIYRDTLPLLNSGRIELLDIPQLATELIGLERRTSRNGRDSIDHAPGAHDDLANAAAGALLMASVDRQASGPVFVFG